MPHHGNALDAGEESLEADPRHPFLRYLLLPPNQPAAFMPAQQEGSRALATPNDVIDLPIDITHYARKTLGIARDSDEDESPAFAVRDGQYAVRDGQYLSARWPATCTFFRTNFQHLHRMES